MNSNSWTKEEKRILRKCYPTRTAKYVAERLDRSIGSIYNKASNLKISSENCGSGIRWSEEEIKKIKEDYSTKKVSEIAKDLGRSVSSVKNKITSMGVRKKKNLSVSEKEKAKNLYENGNTFYEISKKLGVPEKLVKEAICDKEKLEYLYNEKELTQKEIGERLGVPQPYISERMKELGIDTDSYEFWTKEEEKILEENYLKKSKEDILSLLPGRGWEAIKLKAMKLGLARSAEEYRKSEEVERRLKDLAKKNEIRVKFEKKETLSYVLGVLDGDGFHGNEHTLGLEVKSSEFADKFYNALKDLNLNPGRGTRDRENGGRETVWASSKQLVNWEKSMSLEEKMKWLKKKGDEWKYIEGRYESDGTIRPSGSPCICSTDEDELEFIRSLFASLGIRSSLRKQMVYVYSESRYMFFKNIDPIIRNPNGGD